MVNTFLVHSDFRQSAECLDVKRLGKQRVEAFQILRILGDIQVLSNVFELPQPTDVYKRRAWIRELAQAYKNSGWFLCWHRSAIHKVSRQTTDFRSPDIRVIRAVGFYYHPAVLMWLGYEQALKQYINVHIDRWISLGYTNNMERYDVPAEIPQPVWTYDPYFLERHRSNLIRKDPGHYRELFPDAEADLEYFWPFNRPDKFRRYYQVPHFIIVN